MLRISRPSRGALWLVVVAVALAAGIGAGIGIGYAVRGSSVDSLKTANQLQQEELTEAVTKLELRQSRIDALTGDQRSLEDRLGDLREQTGRLQSQLDGKIEEIETLQEQVTDLENRPPVLDVEGLDQLQDQLEADRLLLVELRREDPETREDAEHYWATIKRIAVKSDPALSPKADEVTRDLPAYYDWIEREFVSTREAQISYLLTGAAAYGESVDGFWSAFLMVVIDRIDALGRLGD